jgi:hypothetical protein
MYLALASDTLRHAEQLRALFDRRKKGPVADALWSGHWAVMDETRRHIKQLAERGGLLFWGQPPAIAAARRIYGEVSKC